MNNKFVAIFAVAVIILASAGVVYILTRDNSVNGDTITDARGREVAVPDEINSILAIKSCSLQLVSYFEAVNKVEYIDINESFVGTDSRTHTLVLKGLLQGLPVVDPDNTEAVISANVDLIISSSVDVAALNEEQRKYGVPVFAINADVEFDSDIFFDQIALLGKLFGEEERAEDIVSGIKTMIKNITDNVHPDEELSAYACGMNFRGLGGFLKTTGDYLPFTYSGIRNVSDSMNNKQPYDLANEEPVNVSKPKMIFIDGMGATSSVNFIHDHMGTLASITAISAGDVYQTLPYKSWGTNWVNQLINIYYVASVADVDTFSELGWNFEDKANEIIQLFYPGTDVTYSDIAGAQAGYGGGGCKKIIL
ncbi:MAG: ABC transporter substrate-binding protein [Methanomassiliicoccaceae archaeon]|nr:ABC transporter substrate-binding protein [Methanomassiliicoccaceae archaeon]